MSSLLFPGQGSQTVGMGLEFYENFDLVKKIFKLADERLDFSISKMILEGPSDQLQLTKNTQPAILVVSYSIFKVLRDEFNFDLKSTKSLSGHPLGAASVHEAIYCLIMMKNNFITGSANITDMDDDAKKFPIVSKTETGATLNTVMSNSFGFGGTNAALIFEKV